MSLLSDQHRHMLEVESGLSATVIADRGYHTVVSKAELGRMGFKDYQQRVPALVLPIYNVRGELAFYQLRSDQPRIDRQGKPRKYENAAGSKMALDVPRSIRDHLGDPSIPPIITEGAKKADATVSRGLVCVAIPGVWNWRGLNDDGGETMLADFEQIAFNGRPVYIAFDSDVMVKDPVWQALTRLGANIESRGANVKVLKLPDGPLGKKWGLDDYLVAGRSFDDLVFQAQPLSAFAQHRPGGPYRAVDGCLRYAPDADTDRLLANFTARIVTDVVLDNGLDASRAFEMEATHRNRPFAFTVPAERFAPMNWVFEELGASAIVYPGASTKEHCRVAIQSLSGEIPTRREFTHTGWTLIEGKRKFLSRSGAIGADGLDTSVVVNLTGSLARYDLGTPPNQNDLAAANRSSLQMLEVAPIDVTAPVYASIWRAPLGQTDFSLHLVAQTGAGKSELSALASQHFGVELDARHLAASWSSTANANEALGFAAANVVLAIDDFAPVGSQTDIARQHRDADRLLRGAGNNAGRMRMRADTSLREVRPVRALMFSSGEDTPRGESLRARLLVIEMEQKAMRWPKLTLCQQDAAAGKYVAAMAGFVQWLAAKPTQFDRFQQLRSDYRDQATVSGDHKRTPAIVADLAAAVRLFSDFGVTAGAMNAGEAEALWTRIWSALTQTAARQSLHQSQSEPTLQFREYLGAAILAGRAHLTTLDGSTPYGAIQLGWRTVGTGENERLEPRGDCAGWIDGEGVYLEPKTAYMVAQSIAQRSGESLAVTLQRLKKSLNEKGMLLSVDQTRQTYAIRKRIGGRNVDVLHVSLGFLSSEAPSPQEPDKPDNTPGNPNNGAANDVSGIKSEPDNEKKEPDKPDTQSTQESLLSRFPENGQPNSWKCACGGRNPMSQWYCDRCGKETRAA